ncbi:pyrroline-5-carboxylate reductase [Desulfuromonas acetoxidans]|uniref:pyrroline-5-carboxylate reductase n=1 Tax=Desulfuromonas acetoxidans TaxID=891 RepID=UPI002931974C|nr:pyrroline-5-carboxylate reductase [Desulfuromonas acetoxidans]
MGLTALGFIGGGNMAEALIKGLIASGMDSKAILVAELMPERRQFLEQTYGIETTADSSQVVAEKKVILLAVKPQALDAALMPLSEAFSDDHCMISILAGVKTSRIEAILGGSPRIVRVMPNTPALIGTGAAALSGGRYAQDDDVELARQLFASVGVVEVVAEKLLDAVTGLSGSGPAYVYTIIEALADGGVLEGLPRDVALNLAAKTVAGAAQMVLDTGEHPAVLRDRVCSPGGTTIAAVDTLEKGKLRATLMGAVTRASQRSRGVSGLVLFAIWAQYPAVHCVIEQRLQAVDTPLLAAG